MISIDTVYQKVLALANKEQRGYITPQEYNLFANHAQMEILEQYFYDLNQFKRDLVIVLNILILSLYSKIKYPKLNGCSWYS
jgi:hypothetical protein